jgi:hypothetical protein
VRCGTVCPEGAGTANSAARLRVGFRAPRLRRTSSRGSASDIASQIRSLTRKTLSDGGSESMLSDGSHGKVDTLTQTHTHTHKHTHTHTICTHTHAYTNTHTLFLSHIYRRSEKG